MRACEICKQPIDEERLEFLPQTRLCATHAREIIKYGGEYLMTGKQSSLAKPGSLKQNYGDVTVEQSRNFEGIQKLQTEWEKSQA
jgi:hypothetical protein